MTERKFSSDEKTRSQLLQVTIDLTSILESLPLLVITLARDGTIRHWNGAAERLLGIAKEQATGKALQACGIDWDWTRVLPELRASFQRSPAHIDELQFKRHDGATGYISLTIVWMPDSADQRSHFILVGIDLSDRKQREMQSVQSMKLEAIGQLAAGIAHEINTPVQYVGDNVRFLKEAFTAYQTLVYDHLALLDECGKGPVPPTMITRSRQAIEKADLAFINQEAPNAIRSAIEGVDRIASIVRSLKEFAYPDPGHLQPVDINKSLENTLNVARNEYKFVADIALNLDERLPHVLGFAGELNQVFLNLIINAAHAIGDHQKVQPGRGTITVTSKSLPNCVEIGIGDTGTGIPLEVQSRIFDPFFTTKAVGRGTGQGLFLSHEIIVKRHQGKISFTTEASKGTTFFIRLPIDQGPVLESSPPS